MRFKEFHLPKLIYISTNSLLKLAIFISFTFLNHDYRARKTDHPIINSLEKKSSYQLFFKRS